MTDRSVHLVGSLPADSTREALTWATSILGNTIGPCMPDGETGDRSDWVNRLVEDLRGHPDLELVRDGGWTGYTDTPAFRVRKGRKLRWIDLDYYVEFETSWQAYQDLVHGSGRRFQIGIPGHLDVAAIAFGFNLPIALRNLAPFRDATIREIAAIWARAGDLAVFQLEVPIELVMLSKLPRAAQPAAAKRMAREILRLVEAAPAGARFGLHLCLGDLNNVSMGDPSDAGPLVVLANAIMGEWPAGRVLDYVHVPLAHGDRPPTMDPDYYEPLSRLWIPEKVRFIGGFIHEKSLIKDLVLIRDQIEFNLGRPIDVAASCGLGRRDRKAAQLNLEIARAVALAE
ncbi:MAG: hypothetical protein HKO63_05095 [Acidimicrobiia bacterium]|nr:hypothetical protein [Acidimicrobiia bacterium]